MQIECTKEHLLEGIRLSERVTARNHTLPVLECVLLSAGNGSFSMRATNLDLGVEIQVPAKIKREGVVAVPGNILQSAVAALYGGDYVSLTVSDGNLTITTENSTTVIKAQSHDDFPTLPGVDGGENTTLKADAVVDGMRSVWYSASTSTVKPELASVYVYPDDGSLTFVSTDSFRLAEKRENVKADVNFDPVLIPIRNAQEIMRILESSDGDVDVSVSGNQIAFTLDKVYVTSRLIDGSFPDYQQIIPEETTTTVTVLKQDFVSALKKINIFSDKFNQVTFTIDVSGKQFTLSATSDEVGETTESLQASIAGEDLVIHFNHRYVADCLQSIESESVTLSFNGTGRPVVIRGADDESFLYLVMPMNK
jgi:DNA polymerase-3 subunit beta